MNKTERIANLYLAMNRAGFTIPETSTLLRCSRTLKRWAEELCNGTIQRNDARGNPFRHYGRGTRGPFLTVRVPDRETAALRKVAAVLKSHPTLSFYHQTDPRGCTLYILRPGDVPEGRDPSSCYTNGIAVCL